jgi:tetratricopeptide (TPR) repeat protein
VSNELTRAIEQLAAQLEPPPDHAITDDVREHFYAAMDKANMYRGDPQPLVEALRLFWQTPSAPLFYAGVAYVHSLAAYVQNVAYSKVGLNIAREWLQRAQQITPNLTEPLIVQAFISIRDSQYREARQTLERLQTAGADSFYFFTARMELCSFGSRADREAAYQIAVARATNESQLVYVHNKAARYCSPFLEDRKALSLYQKILAITPEDPWVWHNMSIIYYRWSNLPKAWKCNKEALRIMDFGNAKSMRKRIILGYVKFPLLAIIFLIIIVVFILAALGY